MIYDELIQGMRTFKVADDGTETYTDHPPNRRELRAAAAIKQLIEVNQGLERANATLHNGNITLQHELENANTTIKELASLCAQAEARCAELQGLIDALNQVKPVEIHQENFGVAPDDLIEYNKE